MTQYRYLYTDEEREANGIAILAIEKQMEQLECRGTIAVRGMTNFEKIKQMSAKELAEWLMAEEDKCCSDHVWCESRYCDDVDGDCVICLTEWLNDEVKE
jgi:hypothetical protein